MSKLNRRSFLGGSLMAAAAAGAVPSFGIQVQADDTSANDTLSVAVVGVNGRGRNHIDGFNGKHGCRVTHICDADSNVGKDRAGRLGAKFVQDIRDIVADDSIDIVSIATPNHWHALAAIWAMQNGKDVYVEKPVSHNITEGRRMVQVARKYGKICQTGTQCRSHAAIQNAVKFLQEGGIGECVLARPICYKRRGSIGDPGNFDPPAGLDYDLWQGPASERPITRKRFHYDWHWQYHWGNGDMGNQAPHQIDIARWGLGIDSLSENVVSYGGRLGYKDAGDVANTQVALHTFEGGKKTIAIEVRGLASDNYRSCGWFGCVFHGSEGYIVVNSYTGGKAYSSDGQVIKTFSGGGDHFGNFVQATRARDHKILNADIEEGHLSAGLAHSATISYLLGTPTSAADIRDKVADFGSHDRETDQLDRYVDHLKKNGVDASEPVLALGPALKMDPKTETYAGNDAANAQLTREYRAPFTVPSEKDI